MKDLKGNKIDLSMSKYKIEPSRVPKKYMIDELEKLGFKIDEKNKDVVNAILSYFLRHDDFLDNEIIKNENSFFKRKGFFYLLWRT